MRLTLLRSFALHVDGTAMLLPGGIQRIVAYLALAGRPVGRMRLAGTLWPETSDARAAANLRCGLWRLRQTRLPVVESFSDQIELNQSVSVDVRTATEEARQTLDSQSAEVPERVDCRMLMADVLEDWYDDWVQIEREHFRHLRLHALEALCHRLLVADRPVDAIQVGLAAVAGEPLRESAQTMLIKAHLAEGNRYEAIRQYRSYCAVLKRELGLEPSPDLQALMAGTTGGASGAGARPAERDAGGDALSARVAKLRVSAGGLYAPRL